MSQIAVVSTFPDNTWDIYAKDFLQSFAQFWPAEIPLLLGMDDNKLLNDALNILKQNPARADSICPNWDEQHKAFVERNKGRDDPQEYRKQAVRFCHKVFTIAHALEAVKGSANPPRYLIWIDADVITQRAVMLDEIRACLPKEGDVISTLGRKDWDHSECGWMAFDLQNGGGQLIEHVVNLYKTDGIFGLEQWHDSWVWDEVIRKNNVKWTNLTPDASGRDVWQFSPMGAWSKHYKGPVAKQQLYQQKGGQPQQQIPQGRPQVRIQTLNSIPHEEICKQIARNQSLIKNWLGPCKPTDEEIVVVSAGPQLVAEDVRKEIAAGKKIVAVKNALVPLKAAGITPWACILLDPRPHVANFVKDADPATLWFVASQVHPNVTLELLARGCTVWGYHAAVNAGEEPLTAKQEQAIVGGGSATATRGLYLLQHMGFRKMSLYGYELSYPDKQDMNALDERGQPKFVELTINSHDPMYPIKRVFFTEPQLWAQYEEISVILNSKEFEIDAHGEGIVPFLDRAKKVANLRHKERRDKLMGGNPPLYSELLSARSNANAAGNAAAGATG